MKIKIKNPNEYSYTQSFRNIYTKNTPQITLTTSPQKQTIKNINLTLQYEGFSPIHGSIINNQSPQKSVNQIQNNFQQFTLENYSKRLHSTQKKYSFSVFVKQQKEKDRSVKLPTKSNSATKKQLQNQRGFRGIKKLNNHAIKTIYKNFRNDPNLPIKKLSHQQNDNSLRILSQRQIKLQDNETHNLISKTSRIQSHIQPFSPNKSPQNHPKHFFNTISYGEKFISKSSSVTRQKQLSKFLKTFKQKQSHRNEDYLQLRPQQYYPQNNETFLKIEKCLIEKKDQNFVSDCYDFKEILLRQQQKRQKRKKQTKKEASILKLLNKNKREPTYFQSSYTGKDFTNKYVSQMREKKKMKKNVSPYQKVEDESLKNDIQPW